MEFPSLPRTVYSISPSFRCGGCASALPSSAFAPVIPSRTAGMNACTSPSSRKPHVLPAPTSSSGRPKFDTFVEAFNNERPHEALEMKCPAQLYRLAAALSSHPRTALPVSRPYRTVTSCDRLCVYRKKINLSVSLAGQAVGVKRSGARNLARQLYELRSRVYRSGGKNSAAPRQPLRAKSVTHVLGTICHLCVRSGH